MKRATRKTARLPLMCALLVGNSGQLASAQLPWEAWYLGLMAPPYMDVWVETIDVEDVQGRVFLRAGAGLASVPRWGDPTGWPTRPAGGGRDVLGADLPRRIYVRWQSLVEPQTYHVTVEIPAHARDLMLTRVASDRAPDHSYYRNMLIVGLAPGGVAKAWVRSQSSQPVEVACQQAGVEKKGPYGGHSDGRYRPLSEPFASYVKAHEVPYGSWKCEGPPIR
ncbi:MAG: hypothetical protein GAK43_00036 [Stenotrophomonas maltophilia]|nr:MAG: hypothetical protein GAK43_00036 [Stenotrophomonas maltophilia]